MSIIPQYFFKLNFCKDKHIWPLVHKTTGKNDGIIVISIFKKKKERNVPGSEQVEKGEEILKGTTVDKLYKTVGEERLEQIWHMGVWWEQMKKILWWTVHLRK